MTARRHDEPTIRKNRRVEGTAVMPNARKPLGRPPVYGERKRILLALPVEVVAKLDAKAAKLSITRTAAVQMAVERWVKGGK